MGLDEFMRARGLTNAAFARLLDVTEMSVLRYRRGSRLPRRQVLEKIVTITNGMVTANDFFPAAQEAR